MGCPCQHVLMPDWDELLQRDSYKRAPGATDDQLDAAEQALALMFPAELRSLYLVSDGVVDAAGQWFVIWPLDMLIAENLRRRSDQMLPHEAIAFGDNGAGDTFVVFEGQRAVSCWYPIEGRTTQLAAGLDVFWRGWTDGTIAT